MSKILVIRGGAIGDFILTLPVFRALREMFPQVRLEVLGYPRIAELAYWGGYVDAVRSIEARPVAQFFARKGELDPGWAEYFGSFPIIISYLFDPDQIFRDNIARVSKAQFLAGPHRPSDLDGIPASEVLLKPLERLAIFGADPIPVLEESPGWRMEHGGLNGELRGGWEDWLKEGRTVVFHPGSGSPRKNWDGGRWQELISRVLERGWERVLLVGGEVEDGALEEYVKRAKSDRVRLMKNVPLTELAGVLRCCDVMVGHDSGISHLSAALGVKTLVLWGPTVRGVWQPRGPQVQVLQHARGLEGLGVDEVDSALRAMVGSPQG